MSFRLVAGWKWSWWQLYIDDLIMVTMLWCWWLFMLFCWLCQCKKSVTKKLSPTSVTNIDVTCQFQISPWLWWFLDSEAKFFEGDPNSFFSLTMELVWEYAALTVKNSWCLILGRKQSYLLHCLFVHYCYFKYKTYKEPVFY